MVRIIVWREWVGTGVEPEPSASGNETGKTIRHRFLFIATEPATNWL
jgi:hypothetical protein